MSVKKRTGLVPLLLMLGVLCLTLFLTLASGSAAKRKTRLKTVTIESGKSVTVSVRHPFKGYVTIGVFGELKKTPKKGGFRPQLFDPDGRRIENDFYPLKKYGYKKGENFELWFCNDGDRVAKGTYKYKIINTTNISLKLKLSAYSYSGIATSATVKKTASAKKDTWKKIGSVKNFPDNCSFAAGDKDPVYTQMISDGSLYVYGYKKGTYTVKLTLQNGKTYKCTFKVT